MLQRISLSLGVLALVAGLSVASTGAFFNDTETSTGNTFTAGAIDLKVDSQQHYNNAICVPNTETTDPTDYWWQLEVGATAQLDQYPVIGSACTGTWLATDLGAQQFFNFLDVKPGDRGENTVSLHIDNNPAWACLNIKTTANDENTLIEPESTAGDVTAGPVGNGELAGNLKFQAWLDQGATAGFQGDDTGEGDNIWQVGEPALGNGALSSLIEGNGLTIPLADSVTNGGVPMAPSITNYVGMFWCAGTVTGGAGNLGCDGSTMGNEAQTDSAKVDVTFTVEQARNNGNFVCVQKPS